MRDKRLIGSLLTAGLALSVGVADGQSEESKQALNQIYAGLALDKDRPRGESMIKDSLMILDRLPPTDPARFAGHIRALQFYRICGKQAQADAEDDKLTVLFNASEISPNLSDSDRLRIISDLNYLANMLCPIRHRGIAIVVVAGGVEFDIRRSEAWRLRAVALSDHFPPSDNRRIAEHRLLITFYKDNNRAVEAASQTETLAKLLGSDDPKILFPPPPPCPACGMG